ncbi:hypothetical protein ACROYT_G009342, partial [Oculina patagonica]
MDKLNEFLKPKTFNKVSYVAMIAWTIVGVILCSIFADIENNETRFDFRCAVKSEKKDVVQGKCFDQYRERYNQFGVPVYAFVIVNFFFIGIVCIIYSQTVTSRVDRLLDARKTDAEGPRPPKTHRVAVAYSCQLAARLVLGVTFIVLQTKFLYPSSFPSNFDCDDTPESSRA